MKKKIIDITRFNMLINSYPYCIMIPLYQKYINNTNTEPKYYARTIDSAYSYAINYAKRYMDINNIEKNKLYYDDNGNIKYFVNTKEEVLKTGKVWRYKINDDCYYYCNIIKKSITFSNENNDVIFTDNTYREEIIKIYNFTLRKINNNIIYQDYVINANIYFDYINKSYGDYLSYNAGEEKYKNIDECLTNYITTSNLLLKNRNIVYSNIKNNPITILDREKFMNNKKVIFREILVFTKNL